MAHMGMGQNLLLHIVPYMTGEYRSRHPLTIYDLTDTSLAQVTGTVCTAGVGPETTRFVGINSGR